MASQDKPKYALVTRATDLAGYEFAALMARKGYDLILIDRDAPRLKGLSQELQEKYQVVVTELAKDLCNPVAALEVFQAVKELGIPVEVIITTMSYPAEHGKFTDYGLVNDINSIQLNITSLVSIMKYFLKDMLVRKSGRVIPIVSLPENSSITVQDATTAFILSFTEGLIRELEGSGVVITALFLTNGGDFNYDGVKDPRTIQKIGSFSLEAVAEETYRSISNDHHSKILVASKEPEVSGHAMPDKYESRSRPLGESPEQVNTETSEKQGASL